MIDSRVSGLTAGQRGAGKTLSSVYRWDKVEWVFTSIENGSQVRQVPSYMRCTAFS